jgi:uncharacterized SAM-binding protein YcdF (DUF218 family)
VTTQSRRARTAAGALVGVAVAGLAFVHAGEALVVIRPIARPDAIIVLASHEWERLPVAADAAQRYDGAAVWLTVPQRVTVHNCYRCAERVWWLERAGVDASRVQLLPDRVTNTHDEAEAAAAFARSHPIGRLLIVTSPYHTRRSLATFRRVFAAGGVAPEIGIATSLSGADPERWWRRQYDREYVAYEWAAVVYYGLRFGVPPLAWSERQMEGAEVR